MEPADEDLRENDPDLPAIRRVLDGDPSAFGEIVERHQGVLRRVLLGIVADADQADDVLQDSFLIAYRQISSFRGKSLFKTWLSRITVREAMRARSKLRRVWSLVMPVEDQGLDREDRRLRAVGSGMEDQDEARALLANIPMKERTAFVMFAEGWTHQEISAAMGCPMGTVASWIHRAKGRLEKTLPDAHASLRRIRGAGDDPASDAHHTQQGGAPAQSPFPGLDPLPIRALPTREGP